MLLPTSKYDKNVQPRSFFDATQTDPIMFGYEDNRVLFDIIQILLMTGTPEDLYGFNFYGFYCVKTPDPQSNAEMTDHFYEEQFTEYTVN